MCAFVSCLIQWFNEEVRKGPKLSTLMDKLYCLWRPPLTFCPRSHPVGQLAWCWVSRLSINRKSKAVHCACRLSLMSFILLPWWGKFQPIKNINTEWFIVYGKANLNCCYLLVPPNDYTKVWIICYQNFNKNESCITTFTSRGVVRHQLQPKAIVFWAIVILF